MCVFTVLVRFCLWLHNTMHIRHRQCCSFMPKYAPSNEFERVHTGIRDIWSLSFELKNRSSKSCSTFKDRNFLYGVISDIDQSKQYVSGNICSEAYFSNEVAYSFMHWLFGLSDHKSIFGQYLIACHLHVTAILKLQIFIISLRAYQHTVINRKVDQTELHRGIEMTMAWGIHGSF